MIHRKPSEELFSKVKTPNGLVNGPGIGRSPVRFPAPRRSVQGHFFINFGMSWNVSGDGLGTFSDGFGMVSEKHVGQGRKITMKNQKWPGLYVPSRATNKYYV